MNRRTYITAATLTAIIAGVPGISGCQALDDAVSHLGPRPNEVLEGLLHTADTDAAALASVDPEMSALRDTQANQIADEIFRLCGLDESGQPPESCAVDRTPAPGKDGSDVAGLVRDAAADTLHRGIEAPQESRAVLTEQAVELLSRTFDTDPDTFDGLASTNAGNSRSIEPVPAEASKSTNNYVAPLLKWEDSAIYGLDIARAFLPGDMSDHADTLNGLHSQRAEALRESDGITADKELETPDAYTAAGEAAELPHDVESAKRFLAAVQNNDDAAWTAAAVTAAEHRDAEWLEWLAHQAARGRAAAE